MPLPEPIPLSKDAMFKVAAGLKLRFVVTNREQHRSIRAAAEQQLGD